MKKLFPPLSSRPLLGRVAPTLLALSALTLGACADQANITQAKPQDPNRIIICGEGCGGGGGPVTPPQVSVTSLTPTIGNWEVNLFGQTVTATVTNSGNSLSNVTTALYVTQGNTKRMEAAQPILCTGQARGVLGKGTCQLTMLAGPQNSDPGSGTYIPGPATLVLEIRSSAPTATRVAALTLEPKLFNFTPNAGWSLNGNKQIVSVTFENTGAPMTGMSLQILFIESSTNYRIATNIPLDCGVAASGTLNGPGICNMQLPVGVSNSEPGVGTFIGGIGTVEARLVQGLTVVSRRAWAVKMADGHLTSVMPSTTPARIGGAPQPYTAQFVSNNGAFSEMPAHMHGIIRQGTTERGTVIGDVSCGGSIILNVGPCTAAGTYTADNTAPGVGTLVAGPATLVVRLMSDIGNPRPVLDTMLVPITLDVAPPASISSVVTAGTATVGTPGPSVGFTATVVNAGPAITGGSLRVQLLQGSSAHDATNGVVSFDCGAGNGVIPAGGCTIHGNFVASSIGAGAGPFVTGAASLNVIVMQGATQLMSNAGPAQLVAP